MYINRINSVFIMQELAMDESNVRVISGRYWRMMSIDRVNHLISLMGSTKMLLG